LGSDGVGSERVGSDAFMSVGVGKDVSDRIRSDIVGSDTGR
jgi:hypothetical protein